MTTTPPPYGAVPGELLLTADEAPPGPGSRVARTGGQAGASAFVVVLLVWIARLGGLDLDPDGPGTSPPPEVVVAATGLLTVVASALMNLRKRR